MASYQRHRQVLLSAFLLASVLFGPVVLAQESTRIKDTPLMEALPYHIQVRLEQLGVVHAIGVSRLSNADKEMYRWVYRQNIIWRPGQTCMSVS